MQAAWKYWNITSFPFYYLSSTFYNLEAGTTKIPCDQTPGSCGFDFIFHESSITNDWGVWAEDKGPGGIQFWIRLLLSWHKKLSMIKEELDLWVCIWLMRVRPSTISSKIKKWTKDLEKLLSHIRDPSPKQDFREKLYGGYLSYGPCTPMLNVMTFSSSEGHSADPFVWVPSVRDARLPSQVVWLETGMHTVPIVWPTGWHTT